MATEGKIVRLCGAARRNECVLHFCVRFLKPIDKIPTLW